MNTNLLIVAGEPSGDRHAAHLVEELKKRAPQFNFYGIGGDEMAASGVHLLYHIRDMAFLGLTEVLRHLPFIQTVFKCLQKWLDEGKPAAVILIDYPGFNLRLARIAKRRHIPVIYYICPQLWAWGRHRIKKIRRFVDLPLVIFKFEEEFYARHGITTKFVGHPLVDEIKMTLDEKTFRTRHQLHSEKPIIALLPGSRSHEVHHLLPIMAQAAQNFYETDQYQWVVGKSATLPINIFQALLRDFPFIKIVEQDTHHLQKFAWLALVASGTATLETAYLGTPMIVLYKVSPLTYWIGRLLVSIPNIALVNIVLQQRVVPELLQKEVTASRIEQEIRKYIAEPRYYQKVATELQKVPAILGEAGAAARAADEIVKFLGKS